MVNDIVIVHDDVIEVVTAGSPGPAGPPSLSAGAIVTTAGDLIAGGASGAAARFPLTNQGVYNVKMPNFGAVGDGSTDDYAIILGVAASLPASTGGTVYLPNGVFAVTNALTAYPQPTAYQGAGIDSTTIKATASGPPALLQSVGYLARQRSMVVRDLTLDGNYLVPYCAYLDGDFTTDVLFERVRFTGFTIAALNLQRIKGWRFVDCIWENPGTSIGWAILADEGGKDLQLVRPVIRNVSAGIVISTGSVGQGGFRLPMEEHFDGIEIIEPLIDLTWWSLPVQGAYANVGGTVTYSATTVTDTAAAFAFTTTFFRNVRALVQVHANTPNAVDALSVTFTGAVLGALVNKGDWLESGSKIAIIEGVDRNDKIRHEGWIDRYTRLPVDPPTTATAIAVLSVRIGRIASRTATAITVDRWHNLNGDTATPANGTRYEVMIEATGSGISIERGARNIKVLGGTVRRCWSDQIMIQGDAAQIIGTLIEEGQDMGITLSGSHHLVSAPRIRRQGAGAIYAYCQDSEIANVIVDRWGIQNTVMANAGAITLYNTKRTTVRGGQIDGGGHANAKKAIVVNGGLGAFEDVDDNINNDTLIDGVRIVRQAEDLVLFNAAISAARLVGHRVRNLITDTISNRPTHAGTAVKGDYQGGYDAVPSVAYGTGAGTGATGTPTGGGDAIRWVWSTGTTPAANATVATLTFATPRADTNYIVDLIPTDSDAQAAVADGNGIYYDDASRSTTAFVIKVGSGALSASTSYRFGILIREFPA